MFWFWLNVLQFVNCERHSENYWVMNVLRSFAKHWRTWSHSRLSPQPKRPLLLFCTYQPPLCIHNSIVHPLLSTICSLWLLWPNYTTYQNQRPCSLKCVVAVTKINNSESTFFSFINPCPCVWSKVTQTEPDTYTRQKYLFEGFFFPN